MGVRVKSRIWRAVSGVERGDRRVPGHTAMSSACFGPSSEKSGREWARQMGPGSRRMSRMKPKAG